MNAGFLPSTVSNFEQQNGSHLAGITLGPIWLQLDTLGPILGAGQRGLFFFRPFLEVNGWRSGLKLQHRKCLICAYILWILYNIDKCIYIYICFVKNNIHRIPYISAANTTLRTFPYTKNTKFNITDHDHLSENIKNRTSWDKKREENSWKIQHGLHPIGSIYGIFTSTYV